MMRKLIFTVLFILSATGVSSAEDIGAAKAVNLDRIVVTPSRTEKSLSEVPASVSIITEEDIRNVGAKTVPDVLRNVEGIYAYDATGVGAGGTVNMRGFYGGMSSHHLVLVDGVPQNQGKDKLVLWDTIPIANVERIEVMRGPASSIYGDNAMSGVINIITKKPAVEPHGGVSFTYGTYATRNYGAYLSATTERLGYYLGVSSRLTNGFREHGDYENIQVYGKADYSINDAHNLKFDFNYFSKTQGTWPWSLSEAQIEQNRRIARPGSENDSTSENKLSLDLAHNWALGAASNLETLFYYRYQGIGSFYTSGATQSTTREQNEAENTFGLPVRLNTVSEIFGMNNSVIFGIDLERNNFGYKQYSAPFQTRRGLPVNHYGVTKSNAGPYLQGEFKIIEIVKFILGLRYDWVQFNFDNKREPSDSEKRTMSKMTPNCGLVWTYGKDSELYGSFGQAFRTPTIGQMFTYGSSANTSLQPEEATNYEVGARHRFNERLKTTMSVYWMKLNNEIWYDNATSQYQNYGRTFHDGLEMSADFKVADALTVFGNYTYTRAVDDSDGAFKNKFLTNVPINKGTIGMNIYTDFGFKAYMASTWVGTAYIDSANVDVLGHYNIVDMKISYKYKRLEAFFAVYNLLDKEYNSSGYKNKTTNVNYFTPEPGRTFEFGVSGNF